MPYRKPKNSYSNPEQAHVPNLQPVQEWEHVARQYPSNDDRMSLTWGLRRPYRLRVLGDR